MAEAGYTFDVVPTDLDESNVPPGLTGPAVAEYLAIAKARAIAARFPNAIVLAADTVVWLGDALLGKPIDVTDARRILSMLSGSTHHVSTGVAVISGGIERHTVVTSRVAMRVMSPAELDAYLATGQWAGKAGAYGIQDNDPFVTNMEGSLTNIIGLPMDETRRLLADAGIVPTESPKPNM
jgi:septum formation protein